MHRAAAFLLLCVSAALAQSSRREPFDEAMQAYWTARNEGRFDDAVARRDELRTELGRTPVEAPQFVGRVQGLAQLYYSSGLSLQARAVIQDALSRASGLGDASPGRASLMNALADNWEEDGNLLKAVEYREKAVAAEEAFRKLPQPAAPAQAVMVSGRMAFQGGMSPRFGQAMGGSYERLANLYRRLGRPGDADAITEKQRKLLQDNRPALANLEEQQGNLEAAAALYRQQAEQAAANPKAQPWEAVDAWQALSRVYGRGQQWDEALAAEQQAIQRAEASPQTKDRALSLGLNMANLLQQAGRTDAAGQAYQNLMSGASDPNQQVQALTSYVGFLQNEKRAPEGEKLLLDYLNTHSGMDRWQEANVDQFIANLARSQGNQSRADQYQRLAEEKRNNQPQAPNGQLVIGARLSDATSAAQRGEMELATALAGQALNDATRAADRESVSWAIPNLARTLASKKQPELADQFFQRLFGLAQGWTGDTVQPLIQAQQAYVHFLFDRERWNDVPGAIERYRNSLIAARGAATGRMAEVLQLQADFASRRGLQEEALRFTEDMAALQEALSGSTSEPYAGALRMLANRYQNAGNAERSLATWRQVVAISDLVFRTDLQRGYTRMDAAFSFARARQFDEADRLAAEAVAIARAWHPPQPDAFKSQLENLQRMKTAPAAGTTNPNSNQKWFSTSGAFGAIMTVEQGMVPMAAPPPPPPPPPPRKQ